MFRLFIILLVISSAFLLIFYLNKRDKRKEEEKKRRIENDPERLKIIEAGVGYQNNHEFRKEDFDNYYKAYHNNLLDEINRIRENLNKES